MPPSLLERRTNLYRMHMKKVFSILALGGLLLTAVPSSVSAVPAIPTPITITLADGTQLTVRLHGDESHHFYTTEDNYIILQGKDGKFYYANQNMTCSDMVVTETAQRSAHTEKFLRSIDRETQWSVCQSKVGRMFARNYQEKIGPAKAAYPTTGNQKGIVVLVEYQDVKFTIDNPHQAFHDLLNKEGYSKSGAKGSAADYYKENSNGLFTPTFDVFGPITLPHDRKYYGENTTGGQDVHPELMAVHACEILDDEVDFTEYDRDNDGFIDNVYVFYAGQGEASSSIEETVWPHSWDIYEGTNQKNYFDGVMLNHYACSNELNYYNQMEGIGTFCHEFNHVLGFPDLYATKYTTSFTPGLWTIMDQGSYNNDGYTPPFLTVYERYFFGWLEPVEIGLEAATHTLNHIADYEGFIVRTAKENEYFLLENRQKKGWDEYIPGHGMLIWHIDYNETVWEYNRVNNNPKHQYVDIEEADNRQDTRTLDGDPFPGSKGITEFTDDTAPSMRPWSNERLRKPITDITETDGVISFHIGDPKTGIDDVAAGEGLLVTADGVVCNRGDEAVQGAVYGANGQLVTRVVLQPGENALGATLQSGIYVLTAGNKSYKMLVD